MVRMVRGAYQSVSRTGGIRINILSLKHMTFSFRELCQGEGGGDGRSVGSERLASFAKWAFYGYCYRCFGGVF